MTVGGPGRHIHLVGAVHHRLAVVGLLEVPPAGTGHDAGIRISEVALGHTPKHGSWLNMAEIEFSVLARTCLKGRNADEDALQRNISACEAERNYARATINWRFTTKQARTKMRRLYPDTPALTID